MPGDIEMNDASPIMRNDEEAVQHSEGQREYGDEIHDGNGLAVIAQKRRPSLCRLRFLSSTSYLAGIQVDEYNKTCYIEFKRDCDDRNRPQDRSAERPLDATESRVQSRADAGISVHG
jgi:hypothetical protein